MATTQLRSAPSSIRLVEIVTDAASVAAFLRGHLRHLRECGYDVYVISSPHPCLAEIAADCGVTTIPLSISREISPLKDLYSLVMLCLLLRRIRPHLVAAGTPKGSLLGMLAAWAVGTPVRVYKLVGLRLETCTGFKRWLLSWTERITSACAQRVISISPSLSAAYLSAGYCSPEKLDDRILSSHGVDGSVYRPRRSSPEVAALRTQLGIAENDLVIGFVGRLTRDKGLGDLLTAFRRVQPQQPAARLLLVGEFEAGDPVASTVRQELEADPRVILTGSVSDTSPYYNLMDVFAFPSYREGLPNAPLEAACTEIPVVGFAATGTVDAVVDGETGWLVPVGDAAALAERLLHSLNDPVERTAQGAAGRQRALCRFSPTGVHTQFERLYRALLAERGLMQSSHEPIARVA